MSAGHRYVLLGLARPRASWFRSVSHWTTSAAIPAEFVKCVSVEELRARLAGNRTFSAVLLDGSLPVVDRELLEAARDVGCAVLIVDDGRRPRDWVELGATAVLSSTLEREALLDALVTHAEMVGVVASVVRTATEVDLDLTRSLAPGEVAVVCGAGGTGVSTLAAALAEGLGRMTHHDGRVLLADLALHGEQAMLHDVRDVVPGIQELVEAHRIGVPSTNDVRALTFEVVERRYQLLLGLRQARHWPSIRPHAFQAAFDSLRRAFDVLVCDITADFEGAGATGSVDVDERNLMARHSAFHADVVFVVGRPGVKGMHAQVRVISELVGAGVSPTRVIPVINEAPGRPGTRARINKGIAELTAMVVVDVPMASPVFVPSRQVEPALRDVVSLPAPLPSLMTGAYRALIDRLGPNPDSIDHEPQLVAPGSLGTWNEEGAM